VGLTQGDSSHRAARDAGRGKPPAPLSAEAPAGAPAGAQVRAAADRARDPAAPPDHTGPQPGVAIMPEEVLRRLSARPDAAQRYRLEGQIAEGGMGAILRVWDEDLQRPLAMKVVLEDPAATPAGSGAAPSAPTREQAYRQGRFLEEALVTAQLDHPGIVPVHELGLDKDKRVYFLMKFVKGEDLKEVFARVHSQEPGWTVTRVLYLLLRACEAMAYAHSKRVIHRDLKPANVMVGKFGEVYVMDWGLARVLGRPDSHDVRLRTADDTTARVRSHRPDAALGRSDSPLITMDGAIVGTPQYMPPEQARGQVERLGPTADVYALGAMLYHLVSGFMPYVVPGAYASPHAVLERVQAGPPRPLHELAPEAPAELVAICERAMAREPEDRYPDMTALADDLRAYLEHRVVSAYETGPVAELRKWVGRNKGFAAALAGVALLALTAGGLFAWLNADLQDALGQAEQLGRDLSDRNVALTQLNIEKDAAAATAQREKANVLRLSAFQQLDDLQREADALWPVGPDLVPRYDDWLLRAAALVARLEPSPDGSDIGLRGQMAVLRERALPATDAEREADRRRHAGFADWEKQAKVVERAEVALRARDAGLIDAAELEKRKAQFAALEAQLPAERERLAELERPLRERLTFRFASDDDTWWHAQLEKLIAGITAFADRDTGLIQGLSAEHGWGVALRRERALELEQASLAGDEARARWAAATASIADRNACPAYDGLQLQPQVGLLPMGRDRESGLWEFWVVASGREPQRNGDGVIEPREPDGLVLVLVPGGSFWMGAQGRDPAGPGYDADAVEVEGPVREHELSPFFLSKYEMTQGQWERLTGSNPSYWVMSRYPVDWNRLHMSWSSLHPVERVSWDDCVRTLHWLGLELPTEAQWEYAARAGTTTRWWTGDGRESLAGAANLNDHYGFEHGNGDRLVHDEWLDDGQTVHARIGSYAANPFGLHDVLGNVIEWCADSWVEQHVVEQRLDPLRDDPADESRVLRGGAYSSTAYEVRSSTRDASTPETKGWAVGVRPARRVER